MATTFGDLVEDVLATLHGYTGDLDQVTSLAAGISSSDPAFTVSDAMALSKGIVEIGEELVRVVKVDQGNALATIAPWGRGQAGTTAVAHATGARVTNMPRFPRHRIKTVINQVITSLNTDLYAAKEDLTQVGSPVKMTYPLPADARGLISLSTQTNGPSGSWQPITRYRVDRNASETAYPTGGTVDILWGIEPGRTIKMVYRADLTPLATTDSLLTSSGLPESAADLVTWGALAQLLPLAEFSRLQSSSVEQSDRSRLVQPGQASAAARQAMQMFQLRIEQERRRLHQNFPTVAHTNR